ncbi:MAG TPA: hypothetical protein VHZ29_16850 [Rhizomicrobium sp.]|nr:hypothetical protein [Rhizomicrobium sp.]
MARLRKLNVAFAVGLVSLSSAPALAANVTTYHNDTLRTGWNNGETVLTPGVVKHGSGGQTFKLTASVTLDDQVDAQPLVVAGQAIQGQGTHDVTYVATENNTLYAIDANDGTILLHKNFGPPVPRSALPGGCSNNAANVGIGSTPVIDPATGTLYLIAYTFEHSQQKYTIHAVDLSTLDDVTAPVRVSATGRLADNSKYRFNAAVSRQRSALLLSNGTVYAGFASFCDIAADQSRGWVLGWQKDTLTPLAHNELTNVLTSAPDNFFLTAIWMSGYGLAAQPSTGDIYFVTGNSDPSGETLNSVTNIAESAVQMSADLSTVKGVFTPSNAVSLEQGDVDYGSGGFMLLPGQPNQRSNMGVAAGKDGNMYFFNADNLAGSALGSFGIGSCWCGQSYFGTANGSGRVVASGGDNVGIWKVRAGGQPNLTQVASSASVGGNQDPGFFTSISSNGTDDMTAVIWAVSRPDGTSQHNVSLFAFDGRKAKTLMSSHAGKWPNTGGNSNIVPTVANGKVYVASFKSLAIFGLSAAPAATVPEVKFSPEAGLVALPAGTHEIYGTVRAIDGTMLKVARRDGSALTVDAGVAEKTLRYAEPVVGNGVILRGAYGAGGVLDAEIVMHAKRDSAMWPADR